MRKTPLAAAIIALTAALSLSACGGVSTNRSMYSVHQPVVETSIYSLDVTTSGSGLAYGEEARLAGWFDAMGLKSGDRILIDDASMSIGIRNAIAAAAEPFGIDVDTVTRPAAPNGTARITIARSKAYVPGCPDWKANSDFNPANGTSSNYGCAVNSNLAAMIANPEDLIHGQTDTGSTAVMTSNRAIGAYRAAEPTGKGNVVSQTGSKGN